MTRIGAVRVVIAALLLANVVTALAAATLFQIAAQRSKACATTTENENHGRR